jgi:hypothetical protein
MEKVIKAYPELTWLDEEYFPNSIYIVVDSILIVLFKTGLDIILKFIIPSKLTKVTYSEKLLKKG